VKLETRVGLFVLIAIGVFIYLSINIRALRFDKEHYYPYKAFFDDTGGLALKAPVKIAGVEVGWVERIELHTDGKAEVLMQIDRQIKLAKNAYAMIHQDGLIGTKNLEIDPGDPSTGFLLPGSSLSMPGRTPASVGELLDQFRDIATTIQDISTSFKNVFASRQGEDNMKKTLESVTQASERIAEFSNVLQRSLVKNEENLNTIILDMKTSFQSAKEAIPNISNAIQDNANKFGNASNQAGEAFGHIQDAAVQTRETLKETGEVVEKINKGKGTIGKLINEDETYTDLKKTVRGIKDYVGKTQSLMLDVDMHSESMLRHTYSKGYFELRLRPNSDYFYLMQLVADERGSIKRENIYYTRKDDKGNILRASDIAMPAWRKVEFADEVQQVTQTENDILLGLQFGKRFDRLALRIGLFEGTFGVGCDFYVPLPTDKIHWVTTLELFDTIGTKRLNDTRPHVKWLNKAFFMKNLYTVFGVDDIYSKRSASPFWGGGLRFGDDDLKYFMAQISPGKASGK